MVNRWTKSLTWAGCAVLTVTAFFHTTGFAEATRISNDGASDAFTKMFLEPLWIFPTLNWIIVATIAGYLAIKPDRSHQMVLLLIGLIPLADAIVLFAYTGPFIGAFALALAGSLFIIGAMVSLRNAGLNSI